MKEANRLNDEELRQIVLEHGLGRAVVRRMGRFLDAYLVENDGCGAIKSTGARDL